jgi:hypothetical protein
VNRAYTEMFGYEPAEVTGKSALFGIAPESRGLVLGYISSGHPEPYEAVGLRKDGGRFDAEIRGKEFKYRGRGVRITALRDVIERIYPAPACGSSGVFVGIKDVISAAQWQAVERNVPSFHNRKREVASVDMLLNPEIWVAFLTLLALEIVLGIDNIVFISILVDKLPEERQALARRLGLGLALVMRIILLLSLSWVIGLTAPLFTVLAQEISGRDVILILGGLFLLARPPTRSTRTSRARKGTPAPG